MSQGLVICPVYATLENNRAYLLIKALESICNQGEEAIGLVIDDGSIMDLTSIIEAFPKEKIKYVKRRKGDNETNTYARALNYGINLLVDSPDKLFSSAQISNINGISYLHSDDRLPNNSVKKRIRSLDSNSNCGFVYGKIKVISNHCESLIAYSRKNIIPFKNVIKFPNHTIMWSRKFIAKLRNSNRDKYNCDVFDCNLIDSEDKIASLTSINTAYESNFIITEIDEILYYYYVNNNSITSDITFLNEIKSRQYIAKKYGLGDGSFISEAIRPLFSNIPYSLGHYLPEIIKSKVRPMRHRLETYYSRVIR